MAISWNEPSNSEPAHTEVLADLGEKDTFSLTMCQTDPGYTNVPEGAMKWDNSQNLFRRLESSVFNIKPISLAGGGTGATDAAGARTVLQVNKTGTGASEARTNSQNDLRFVQPARSISTTSPLTGGGDLSANRTLSVLNASTSQVGVVKLENTLNSTSTVLALTAAQGKVLNDLLAGNTSSIGTLNTFMNTTIDYNEEQLLQSGGLSSGSCKVVKVGSMVTISGSFFHSGTIAAASATGYIPSWARPSASVLNSYIFEDASNGLIGRRVTVSASGQLTILYSESSTASLGFTISYTI